MWLTDYIILLITMLVSMMIFKVLFHGLNRSILHLFGPLQKRTKRLKNKKRTQNIIFYLLIIGFLMISNTVDLNSLASGIIMGCLISLIEIIFYDEKITS
ncbi:hypothetical protein [Terrilactibacillus laevilacticus]|uniref:Uncharacterized protein n=1 Tax=Terrilactibacillus laevilacticus TaxID=1380157 RepID=A0ABW5PPL1_9BACI|nr:hypothetical protein [Terrilactibacillus laevilacticus]